MRLCHGPHICLDGPLKEKKYEILLAKNDCKVPAQTMKSFSSLLPIAVTSKYKLQMLKLLIGYTQGITKVGSRFLVGSRHTEVLRKKFRG